MRLCPGCRVPIRLTYIACPRCWKALPHALRDDFYLAKGDLAKKRTATAHILRAFALRRELAAKAEAAGPEGVCRWCGCTEARACMGPGGMPCYWADDDHTACSVCEPVMAAYTPDLLDEALAEFESAAALNKMLCHQPMEARWWAAAVRAKRDALAVEDRA